MTQRTVTLLALAISSSLSAQQVTNSIGMKLVEIHPGSFTMGQDGPAADYNVKKHAAQFDDADWDEKPAHRVTISQGFQMASTEVTLEQFRQFRPEFGRGKDDDAVTDVSWNDAVAFCHWLSKKEGKLYRLPTEAEWEYACRAGTTTLFNTGDALPAGSHSWPRDTGLRDRFFPDSTLPPEYRPKSSELNLRVAQNPANAWGLHDMHGNVAEWCADWYAKEYYAGSPATNPPGAAQGTRRVVRGRSFGDEPKPLTFRYSLPPAAQNVVVGFRVCYDR